MRGQRRETGIIEDDFFISKEELEKIITPYMLKHLQEENERIQGLEEYSDDYWKGDIYCSSIDWNFEEQISRCEEKGCKEM